MRVSLSPLRHAHIGEIARSARMLLDPAGPRAIIGALQHPDRIAEPIVPRSDTLFGPRGVALASGSGPIAVSDTGHHRLLIWTTAPANDGVPADILIGQPDFGTEGRNAKGSITAATLNVPTGVAIADNMLAVADAWNHRVLIWLTFPSRHNQPADVVLGQAMSDVGLANRGSDRPGPDTLNWCYGVTISGGALYVADTGNRRVLKWNQVPTRTGAPADLVLGHDDFTSRDENGGHAADARSMRWPHAIAECAGRLLVVDAGNNRVMVWNRIPASNGVACDVVLGQRNCAAVDHNQAAYYPSSGALNMPYGMTKCGGELIVADTANSRLLGFDIAALAMGADAASLAGQPTFHDKGDNRWGVPMRDSFCWPYGLAAADNMVAIADSGNNRVLLWEAAR